MQLSVAIRLGAMLRPQAFNGVDDGETACAMNAACLAAGICMDTVYDYNNAWPVNQKKVKCPECGHNGSVGFIITCHLNDQHRWTRERIADWVATIEPQEVESETTPVEASSLEVNI